MKRRLARATAAATMFALVTSSVAAADRVSATLDGHPIRIDRIADLNCHDFDYPVIRCFSSPAAVAADIAARTDSTDGESSLGISSVYVTVFEHAFYDGASMTLSSDRPWLSSIGWNDRISSFKSFGATGGFYEDSPSGGFYYTFGSTTQVSSLSGTYNDKFSAFDIT